MADGCNFEIKLEKSSCLSNSSTYHHEIWQGDGYWYCAPYGC